MREDVQADGTYFENIEAAAEYLEKTTGNILITTGSKEIAKFSAVSDRAFAHVLPSEESLELCKKENGVECIIIKRPTDESGMTVSEVEKMILEWL